MTWVPYLIVITLECGPCWQSLLFSTEDGPRLSSDFFCPVALYIQHMTYFLATSKIKLSAGTSSSLPTPFISPPAPASSQASSPFQSSCCTSGLCPHFHCISIFLMLDLCIFPSSYSAALFIFDSVTLTLRNISDP